MSSSISTLRAVCVYCGSQPGRDPAYRQAGAALGRALARHGLRLIYGGGTLGIMGAVADAVMSNGGRVTGIIPEFLMEKEATHQALDRLDELIVTQNMHERKHAMFERADAFIALPGGIGTLEEIIEILTWAQLGRHEKPIVFVNTEGFWDPLLSLIEHMVAAGFVHTAHRVRPLVVARGEDVVPRLLSAIEEAEPLAEGDAAVIDRL